MRVITVFCAVAIGGLLLAGCDWTSSGQDGGWSSNYEAVNFSGVYRGRNGGPVLSGGGSPSESTQTVTGEEFAVGNGGASYAGHLKNTPLVPGSVNIYFPGRTYTDDGNKNLTSSPPGGSGKVDYGTGFVSIITPSPVPNGTKIYGTYSFRQTLPGVDGVTMPTLTVTQSGQKLEILTSNGILFKGQFGGISSSGIRQDALEDIVAEFSARTHFEGSDMRLVGVFQTTLTHYFDVSFDDDGVEQRGGSWFTTSARVINATWTTAGSTSSLDVYAEAPSQEQRRTN